MSRGWKILFAMVIGVIVLTTAVCAGSRIWLAHNAPRIHERGEVLFTKGQEFGRGKAGIDCVNEGLRRLRACSGIACEAENRMFLRSCLETASVDFCGRIPGGPEIMPAVVWRLAECERRGLKGDGPCMRLMGSVQEFCERKKG